MNLFPTLLLLSLLGAAVWHDVRARRIPNAIVFPGALAGLALQVMLPAGDGLFATPMGGLGILQGLGGLGLGLAVLLPMYALRLMGAGDVKLLAMVGAFVGAGAILTVAIATLLAGGVLALVHAACQGSLRKVLGNTRAMLIHTGFSALGGSIAAPGAGTGRLPYAVAIGAASAACVLWLRFVGELPL